MENKDAFITHAVLEHVEDRNEWKVAQPLTYHNERFNVTITVPIGFQTDLASVPRIAWDLIPPMDAHIVEAAIVHDWLYYNMGFERPLNMPLAKKLGITPTFTRMQCDRILSDAMKTCGAPWLERHIVYWAVRIGGWKPWRNDARRIRSGNAQQGK